MEFQKEELEALEPNYFTCTLGEAAILNFVTPHGFKTINEFIDLQAQQHGNLPAVCFPPGRSKELDAAVFTFGDLRNGSIATAMELKHVLPNIEAEEKKCVALLCPSSIDFLFMWLGLMRCGYSVLLIAPQCQPLAISHLCNACNVSDLFFDKTYENLARLSAGQDGANFAAKAFPWQDKEKNITSLVRSSYHEAFNTPRVCETDVAYIFHTSGTSTGQPKPIPQTHHAAIVVLPCLDGSKSATFTTTPLYHGGIADCFRAWTSSAMIWLFPAADIAITSKNIIQCLSTAKKASSELDGIPAIKYFSSVPYILQMLSEDPEGLEWLKSMSIVGVGGAALPSAVGDKLVAEGVNLASRFGSAECGFLLSSHRKYDKDKDWQYLRAPKKSKYLRFEAQEDCSGLSELTVLKGWPHMAKTNKFGGNFATSDLFEPHPKIDNAWRYHSRSDSQITLVTGKKFDPAPIEEALSSSSSSLIRDVLLFGNGRSMPGALVFPSKKGEELGKIQLLDAVWEEIQKLNQQGQDHTRIAKEMVVIMPTGTEPLTKSSKGTVLRGSEESRFKSEISKAYGEDEAATTTGIMVLDSEILPLVRKLVCQVLDNGKDLDDDADFYHGGVDSRKATLIRNFLQKETGLSGKKLPWNVVYDTGNIGRLAQYIINLRHGEAELEKDETTHMLDLLRQSSESIFDRYDASTSEVNCKNDDHSVTVLLTGATGALGAHILDLLLEDPAVVQIFCLVRASSPESARSRVNESLRKRERAELSTEDNRVHCLPATLGERNLGLSDSDIVRISCKTNIIIHAAWNVNFSLPLDSFVQDHIGGLVNLLRLSLQCARPVRFLFCSSTASVLGPQHPKLIRESISGDPADSNTLGYSKSKWVAEAICNDFFAKRPKGNTIAVLRIGQLTAHSETGVWNMTEAWPLMLSAGRQLHCLPDLDEPLAWLPVDVAAQSVVDIAITSNLEESEMCPVYHLVSNSTETSWKDLLHWLRYWKCNIVDPQLWFQRLDELKEHPAKALLGLWRNAYGGDDTSPAVSTDQAFPLLAKESVCFSTNKAEDIAEAMRNVRPIGEGLVVRMASWLERTETDKLESEEQSVEK